MRKTSHAPDPIRDAPDGHGEGQSPGPTAVLPGRAIMDTRFNRYPMTLRVLAYACGHAKTWTATFFVNQRTIANDLECSQQAVSQHFRRLVDFGYLEKLRQEDNRRAYGKQGAVWRVIFDPSMSYQDILKLPEPSTAKTPEEEAQEADAMMELAARGAKGQLTKQKRSRTTAQAPACSTTPRVEKQYKPQLVQGHKPQLVLKHHYLTIEEKDKEEECRRICNNYSQACAELYGRGWVYDDRQMDLASRLIDLGYTAQSFDKRSRDLLHWMRDKGKQAPSSLQYFVAMKEGKRDDPLSVLKRATSRMKVR